MSFCDAAWWDWLETSLLGGWGLFAQRGLTKGPLLYSCPGWALRAAVGRCSSLMAGPWKSQVCCWSLPGGTHWNPETKSPFPPAWALQHLLLTELISCQPAKKKKCTNRPGLRSVLTQQANGVTVERRGSKPVTHTGVMGVSAAPELFNSLWGSQGYPCP